MFAFSKSRRAARDGGTDEGTGVEVPGLWLKSPRGDAGTGGQAGVNDKGKPNKSLTLPPSELFSVRTLPGFALNLERHVLTHLGFFMKEILNYISEPLEAFFVSY